VRLIKADVEGAELEVFRGLRRTLAAARPVLIFEVLDDWRDPAGDPTLEAASRRRSDRAAALSDLLTGAGYRLFAARPEGLIPLERIERIVSDDLALCTYAAAPEAEADRFAGRAAARRG
jgi:hypothetical protein